MAAQQGTSLKRLAHSAASADAVRMLTDMHAKLQAQDANIEDARQRLAALAAQVASAKPKPQPKGAEAKSAAAAGTGAAKRALPAPGAASSPQPTPPLQRPTSAPAAKVAGSRRVQAQPRGSEYLDRTKVKVGGLKEGTSLAVIKAAFEHAANCGRPRSEWISLVVEWLQSKRSQQPYDPDADLDAPLPEDQPPADGGKGRIAVVTVPDAGTGRTVVAAALALPRNLAVPASATG